MREYAKEKIKLLRDFDIHLTKSQKQKFYNAESEYQIDRMARDLLQPYDI